ncbi:MAG: WD40 repeat domain-containing serine/threonine protein kinase, partial [Planctomycetota bacterium JB042]
MSIPSDDEAAARLFDFVTLYLDDVEAGAPRPLAEYQARFPGAEREVAVEFARLETGRTEADAAPVERISHFRPIRRVGVGGQAVVVLAEDERTGRRVALKVLAAPTAALLGERRRRLEREARVLARLDHPGLCGVEESDLEHDPPFLAMRFVEGETLRRAVVDRAPPSASEIDQVLGLIERVALALDASHQAGVVHRDVKPDNIMVTPDGAPVVLDFGLARVDRSTSHLTRPGDACGTLAYMAPEQLDDEADAVDRRADVYSLGVTLYECLTGARPFDAPTRAGFERAIRVESVPDPRRWNEAISRDLRTVLETAMEKNAARRYDSARAFADDLRRLREGRPILARPAGVLVHLVRFGRRHPTFSLSAGLAFVLLATGLFVVLRLLAEVREERDAKEVALARARGLVYAAAAGGKVLEDDPTRALGLAVEAGRRAPGRAANDALYAALDAGWEQTAVHIPGTHFRDLALDPRRGELVVVVGTPAVHWYGIDGGSPRRVVATPVGTRVVRVAEDGTVAGGGEDGSVWRIDVGSDRPSELLPPGAGAVADLAFDPPGRRLVVARKVDRPWLVDVSGRTPPIPLDGHAGPATHVAFAPDGERFLTGSDESPDPTPDAAPRVLVRAAGDGAVLVALGGHRGELRGARFSPDSTRVLTWGLDRTVRLLDAADGRAVLPPLVLPGAVHQAVFSPGGRRIAAAFDAGTAMFDLEDGRRAFLVESPTERAVFDVSFSPDGRRLAIAALDRTARILDAADGAELRVLRGHHTFALLARFTPDATRLVTQENSGEFHVFHLDSRPHLPVLADGAAPLTIAGWSPSGDRVLTASDNGTARVFDATDGKVIARP